MVVVHVVVHGSGVWTLLDCSSFSRRNHVLVVNGGLGFRIASW